MVTLQKIGHRAPAGIGDIIDVVADSVEDDGMIFELHESGIIGAYHDAVGLITYYDAGSLENAYKWIAER